MTTKRIAYGYSTKRRPVSEADFGHAEISDRQFFIDTEKTGRAEWVFLIDNAIRQGDTLVILSRGQLGHGGEIPIREAAVRERGGTVEVCPLPVIEPKKRGRKSAFLPTPEDDKVLRECWLDPVHRTATACLEIAKRRTGVEVNRHQMNRRYGARTSKIK